jgi:hypothetical protein
MNRLLASRSLCMLLLVLAVPALATGEEKSFQDRITPEMRTTLTKVNAIHNLRDQATIDDAVEELHRLIAKSDPEIIVPLAVPHLLRLAPRDTQTRAVLRQAVANGWLEESLAHAFLVQAGDTPGPHIDALLKLVDSEKAETRSRALLALGACGKHAEPALTKLRNIIATAKVNPDDYRRDYMLGEQVPDYVNAHTAILQIEAALKSGAGFQPATPNDTAE